MTFKTLPVAKEGFLDLAELPHARVVRVATRSEWYESTVKMGLSQSPSFTEQRGGVSCEWTKPVQTTGKSWHRGSFAWKLPSLTLPTRDSLLHIVVNLGKWSVDEWAMLKAALDSRYLKTSQNITLRLHNQWFRRKASIRGTDARASIVRVLDFGSRGIHCKKHTAQDKKPKKIWK